MNSGWELSFRGHSDEYGTMKNPSLRYLVALYPISFLDPLSFCSHLHNWFGAHCPLAHDERVRVEKNQAWDFTTELLKRCLLLWSQNSYLFEIATISLTNMASDRNKKVFYRFKLNKFLSEKYWIFEWNIHILIFISPQTPLDWAKAQCNMHFRP